MAYSHQGKTSRGFTLIELMIVVAVIGIIAVIAYPSYTDYVRKAKRSVAKTALLDIAAKQEQYYMDNKSYAANLTLLGFAAANTMYDGNGAVTATAGKAVYTVSVAANTATTFSLQAVAQNTQTADAGCTTFTYNHLGSKGPAACW